MIYKTNSNIVSEVWVKGVLVGVTIKNRRGDLFRMRREENKWITEDITRNEV